MGFVISVWGAAIGNTINETIWAIKIIIKKIYWF